jgi:hypothetical protein
MKGLHNGSLVLECATARKINRDIIDTVISFSFSFTGKVFMQVQLSDIGRNQPTMGV